jgi:hypothetical protein
MKTAQEVIHAASPARLNDRNERRNAKRRKVHLAKHNARLTDMRAACGSLSDRLTVVHGPLMVPQVTCETCRTIALKQGGAL